MPGLIGMTFTGMAIPTGVRAGLTGEWEWYQFWTCRVWHIFFKCLDRSNKQVIKHLGLRLRRSLLKDHSYGHDWESFLCQIEGLRTKTYESLYLQDSHNFSRSPELQAHKNFIYTSTPRFFQFNILNYLLSLMFYSTYCVLHAYSYCNHFSVMTFWNLEMIFLCPVGTLTTPISY